MDIFLSLGCLPLVITPVFVYFAFWPLFSRLRPNTLDLISYVRISLIIRHILDLVLSHIITLPLAASLMIVGLPSHNVQPEFVKQCFGQGLCEYIG